MQWRPISPKFLESDSIRNDRLPQPFLTVLPFPEDRKRVGQVVLRHRPVEFRASAVVEWRSTPPFLKRPAVGGNRLLQTSRPALPFSECPKRDTKVVLGRRPIERSPITRPFLKRHLVDGDRLLKSRCPALPLPQHPKCDAEVVLDRCPF
jgi:hypothetical protein